MLRSALSSSLRFSYSRPSLGFAVLNAARMYSNKVNVDSTPFKHGPDPIVKFTENHEWIAVHKDNVAYVGITKYAADALGDTTFVEVNDVDTETEAGDSIGSVESVKSASDVYAPIGGKLIAKNEELIANAALLNEDPMGEAWLAQIEVSDPAELEKLLTSEQYESFLKDAH